MLKGQQHPTHSTLLNAFHLTKLVRQQRCYLLLKERCTLVYTHTHTTMVGDTAALAKHCCRADKTSLNADERLSKVLCHRR